MAKKNDAAEIFTTVAKGLASAWKSYKRSASIRHQDPFTSRFGMLFVIEVSDVEAAKYLAQDIREIRTALEVKKTDRAFKKIVKDSLS